MRIFQLIHKHTLTDINRQSQRMFIIFHVKLEMPSKFVEKCWVNLFMFVVWVGDEKRKVFGKNIEN